MSDETKATADGLGDMMRLWFEMASRATEATQAWAGAAASPEAFRQGRTDLFKAWGDSWERFLRSAQFLEAQKRYMTGSVELRQQIQEQLGRFQHELQLATSQDIDQLMSTVRRVGHEVREQGELLTARLNGLSARVDALAARLAARENGKPVETAPLSSAGTGESQSQ